MSAPELNVLSGGRVDPATLITDPTASLEAAVGALALAELDMLADRFGGIGAITSERRRILLAHARDRWLRKLAGIGDQGTWQRLRAVGRGEES